MILIFSGVGLEGVSGAGKSLRYRAHRCPSAFPHHHCQYMLAGCRECGLFFARDVHQGARNKITISRVAVDDASGPITHII